VVTRSNGAPTGVHNVRTGATWAVVAALVACVWWAVHPGAGSRAGPVAVTLRGALAQIAAWLVFAAAIWLVRKVPPRRALPLIMVGVIGLQLAALSAPPRTSSDAYRYVWDGRVQAAGIDPYRYAPAAPELAGLRDPEFLWARTPRSWCVDVAPHGCTLINRPAAHTIYPPVAEGYFTAVHALSPPGARLEPIQVAAALVAIATTLLLVIGMARLGRDPRLAAYWAWCPLVALEAGNNAHVDVVAAGLSAVALLVLARSGTRPRALLGGGLLGLAIAAKLFPALLVPAAARRRPVTILIAAAAALAAVYLPHVIAVGGRVIGYLPGYLKEEGYDSGSRFALLGLVLPRAWAGLTAAAVLAVAALLVWRAADPGRPWRGALVMTGVFLLVTSPALPWYALLVVVLVALDGRAEWLAVGAAGHVMWALIALGLPGLAATRIGYGGAAAAVLAFSLWRRQAAPAMPATPASSRSTSESSVYGAIPARTAPASPSPSRREHSSA
jgi:hypothetical protein